MHGTTTGLLLKKSQLDSQRSHAITQARSKSTVKLQVETDSSIDVIQEIINAAVRISSNTRNTFLVAPILIFLWCCSLDATLETTDRAKSQIATTFSCTGSAFW